MKRILILCGGKSPEHKISIRSCRNILKAIDREKYAVTLVGISTEGRWGVLDENQIPEEILELDTPVTITPGASEPFRSDDQSLGAFDAVFPVLHGPNGEDGTIQGLLEMLAIPYVGCGVLSSSVAMDKDLTKRLLAGEGIKVSKWVMLKKEDAVPYHALRENLSGTLFVKPANMGSSVGVHRVTNQSEWEGAIKDAFLYDRKVLVEQEIKGRELECAVLGNESPQASGVGEVKSGDFYSYEEKYEDTSVAEIAIPAQVTNEALERLKHTAIAAYRALECSGLARVDMFLTEEGEVYVNEINTLPGFTSISMYPKLWEKEGIGYSALIDRLITLALER